MGIGRTLRRTAAGGFLLAGAAALGAVYVLRQPLPRTKGRLTLKGVREHVEIIRDRWGVPHIYAKNLHDLLFAVGFAQAQDRLWQMDFNRRAASGTLSETLGEAALEIDRLVRRAGFRRLAEQEWSRTQEDERAVLQAFAEGVNAYIRRGRFPLEFRVLRTRPHAWAPVDSLAFGHFFQWALTGNWDSEILRSWTIERFGAALMAELEPKYPAGGPLIVPPGAQARGVSPELIEDFRETEGIAGLVGQAMSNNWAVDGQKSATGKPLLASDPHLPLGIPPIWWEAHLDSPEMKAAGVVLPGLPGVMMGHNERIAWGMTAALVDGDDLFVEQVNPENPSQYRYRGKWVNGMRVREEIKVRSRREPVVEDVLVTRNGPVVSPAIRGETRTLAMRTVALEASHPVRAQLSLMGARNWDEFREALSAWPAPSLNFGYADVDGNIGYQLAGLTPVRGKGYGVAPMPGWTGEYEWTGFVPFEELPHAYNPPTHWVASANNQIADEDYPHFLGASYADSPRQRRIIELLEEKEKLTVEDFKSMQVDVLSLPARDLLPLALELKPKDDWGERALNFLRAWDHHVAADSVGACIFEVFFTHLVRRTLEEKVGSWSDFFMGKGVHPLRHTGLFFGAAHAWLMEKMRERPAWFEGKTWTVVMEESLESAVAELRRLLGDEVSRWQWGRLHKQRFRHPLGEVRGLDRVFNRGPAAIGGDWNTVWQAGYSPYHGYDANAFSPSWRQIIDLSDFNRSQAVLPTGQSGHPGSPHYQDMIGMWQRGEYHPMPWDREEVERYAARRLELASAESGSAGGEEV
jgi:penicillin amidase